jgi:hypothetical protein
MRMRSLLLALTLLPAPLLAETPLTAEEFEAEVTGRTLTYATPLGPYGVERYMSGRRVTWGFIGGDCYEGVWFPQDDAICFAYDGIEEIQCWRFWREDQGLRAEFTGGGGGTLFELAEDGIPLVCGGVGV